MSPALTGASEATVRPVTSVFSVKCDAVAVLAKVASVSVTVSSAPSRVASVSVAGMVDEMAAVGFATTVRLKVSWARSLFARLSSPSWA